MNESIDYPYVLGHLQFNRVSGAVYYTLNKLNLIGKMVPAVNLMSNGICKNKATVHTRYLPN
jgi:hypothetical protein